MSEEAGWTRGQGLASSSFPSGVGVRDGGLCFQGGPGPLSTSCPPLCLGRLGSLCVGAKGALRACGAWATPLPPQVPPKAPGAARSMGSQGRGWE